MAGIATAMQAQTERATTLQAARTFAVSTSDGQRTYYDVTAAQPLVIHLRNGQWEFPDKTLDKADISSMRTEVPQKFLLNEDSTAFTPYLVDHGLLALRRSLQLDKWNTLALPVAITGRQLTDAFGKDMQLATFKDIIETETEAQVNFQTLSLDTDETVLEPGIHYLIRPTREPDIALGKTSSVNYGSARVPGPAWLIAGTNMAPGNKNPQLKTFQSEEKTVRVRYSGSYYLREDQTVTDYYLMNEEGNFVQTTGKADQKGFTSWLAIARNTNQLPIQFYIDGISLNGEISGISLNNRETINNYRYYDLQGRCIQHTTLKHGIYIVNGKKVYVR